MYQCQYLYEYGNGQVERHTASGVIFIMTRQRARDCGEGGIGQPFGTVDRLCLHAIIKIEEEKE
ncbi:hypothetical protein [Paenibacillus sp. YIM B09110]|uniref:hypothetical protein n=1 Tax=Paenibacillus sp. YIM B09110 TaxID=3126102 RepID=UPI00301CC37E